MSNTVYYSLISAVFLFAVLSSDRKQIDMCPSGRRSSFNRGFGHVDILLVTRHT